MATIRHLLVVCGVMGASALDLTWLPADPDGPLPLSTKFRESLARLCDIAEGDGAKPPELVAKLPEVLRLCEQLRASQRVARAPRRLPRFLTAGLVGVGAWAYTDFAARGPTHKWLTRGLRTLQRHTRRFAPPPAPEFP